MLRSTVNVPRREGGERERVSVRHDDLYYKGQYRGISYERMGFEVYGGVCLCESGSCPKLELQAID